MNKKSECKVGEKNPQWKGDGVGYNSVHEWVRNRKEKPELCVRCNKRKAIDLANISGLYKRDVDDYEYLCRKCHMDSDGRNEQLRESGKSRKLKDINCEICGILFHPLYDGQRSCGMKCRSKLIWKTRKENLGKT